jgi:hypothetical protein
MTPASGLSVISRTRWIIRSTGSRTRRRVSLWISWLLAISSTTRNSERAMLR